jgi:5'-methylthioadenosine phosphorylase
MKIPFHKNKTVITIEGPRFSTKAESHMFRSWNADVINMSTVPEVNLAREKKMHYAAIAMSTDYDCWREGEEPVTWEIIMKIMQKNADNVIKLFLEVIPKIGDYNDVCIK